MQEPQPAAAAAAAARDQDGGGNPLSALRAAARAATLRVADHQALAAHFPALAELVVDLKWQRVPMEMRDLIVGAVP